MFFFLFRVNLCKVVIKVQFMSISVIQKRKHYEFRCESLFGANNDIETKNRYNKHCFNVKRGCSQNEFRGTQNNTNEKINEFLGARNNRMCSIANLIRRKTQIKEK